MNMRDNMLQVNFHINVDELAREIRNWFAEQKRQKEEKELEWFVLESTDLAHQAELFGAHEFAQHITLLRDTQINMFKLKRNIE